MTSFSDRPIRRLAMAVLACGLLVGAAACGGDDDDAAADSRGESGGSGESGGDSGSMASEAAATPQNSDLDVQVRSEEGVTMSLSSISFEGDNILVDLEFLNGSTGDVDIHSTTWEETQLRLVDADGNAYNFLQPEDAESDELSLAQGESLNGTLEFLGPLASETDQLWLVTNIDGNDPADLAEWQPGTACSTCGGQWPGLVAEIPIEWA